MEEITFPVTETVVLTGAGFTHNFGGFLARTMWAEVHNRAHKYNEPRIVNILKTCFDYEYIYNKVLYEGSFTDTEKDAILKSTHEAYEALDCIARFYNNRDRATTPIDTSLLSDFILRFAGKHNERGFFFTLNQDTFIERYFDASGLDRPRCPGIKIENNLRFSTYDKRGNKLNDKDFGIVPTWVQLEKQKEDLYNVCRLFYIKLHGSYDWKDSSDKNKLIIGTNKTKDIQSEPILKWYLQLFNKVLSMPNRRLLIIGYGFRDPHINEVLIKSIKGSGLKIYVICPMDPEEFLKRTLTHIGDDSKLVWEAIVGYYPYNFIEIFPKELPKSQHLINIERDIFGH